VSISLGAYELCENIFLQIQCNIVQLLLIIAIYAVHGTDLGSFPLSDDPPSVGPPGGLCVLRRYNNPTAGYSPGFQNYFTGTCDVGLYSISGSVYTKLAFLPSVFLNYPKQETFQWGSDVPVSAGLHAILFCCASITGYEKSGPDGVGQSVIEPYTNFASTATINVASWNDFSSNQCAIFLEVNAQPSQATASVTTSTITVSGLPTFSPVVKQVKVLYRKAGTHARYTQIYTSIHSSSLTITNLEPCQKYNVYYRIKGATGGFAGSNSAMLVVQTSGCIV